MLNKYLLSAHSPVMERASGPCLGASRRYRSSIKIGLLEEKRSPHALINTFLRVSLELIFTVLAAEIVGFPLYSAQSSEASETFIPHTGYLGIASPDMYSSPD